jgi:glycerophosphoryl diester phosphodiesterase
MLAATTVAARLVPPYAVAAGSTHARQQNLPPPFFVKEKHPDVIAHRGGDGQWPGETMYAFKRALKLGVDVLEMDVYCTNDGHIVLMHNDKVNGTTDGHGPVNSYKLEDIRKLNAGYHWKNDGGKNEFYKRKLADVPPEIRDDLRVAMLEEVFEAVKEFPDIRLNIEMKKADISPVSKLLEVIQHYKMEDRVLVASFKNEFMDEFREMNKQCKPCPTIATSASVSLDDLKKIIKMKKEATGDWPGPHALQIPYLVIDKGVVDLIHEHHLYVHAWTVNKPTKMQELAAMGVDGIITDYPGPLLSVLGRIKPT